ncbi:MAG: hypothetical protein ABIF10_03760 [Candidatus Woesearchaeota archaeon]
MLTRRDFLGNTALGMAAVASPRRSLSGSLPESSKGMLIADLHTHMPAKTSHDELFSAIAGGVVGITAKRTGDSADRKTLTYEDCFNLFINYREGNKFVYQVDGVDKNLMARVEKNGEHGFFLKTQEILSKFHVLALFTHDIGENNYLPTCTTTQKSIATIRGEGAKAVICHPYVVSAPFMYRLISHEEFFDLENCCKLAGNIERHNAQCIDLVPYIPLVDHLVPDVLRMKRANLAASLLADKYHVSGLCASDARLPSQVRVAGTFVPDNFKSVSSLADLLGNNFDDSLHVKGYVDVLSWLQGNLLS